MIHLDDTTIIPIGCSCINQFQIDFFFGKERSRGSLFQWSITTPRATVEVLEQARAGTLAPLFAARERFEMEGAHLHNRCFDGFYHWHEDGEAILGHDAERFARFAEKSLHLMSNTFAATGPVWLLWSNIQPNLRQEIEDNTRLAWADFRLTRARRDAIRTAAHNVFADPRFVFVGRKEDVDAELWGDEEVVLMDLPRSDKFRGAKGLYAEVFARIEAAA
ncbi:hypothetical protein C8N35_108179 [Breoghania corrubedonensis]|uniref:Uncharacterized protein n=1 Tax=Breoghania corrubedonensis TaxID=665038 RepID=A0A2T5V5V6_9HYPH|nr:hypothetical protein [Breoghania corrubedonensis]PTW59142.1 hypothetical protein C8N35_108179 [Breoghania corrubedonensis]